MNDRLLKKLILETIQEVLSEEKKHGEELEKSVKSSSVSRLKKAQQNFFSALGDDDLSTKELHSKLKQIFPKLTDMSKGHLAHLYTSLDGTVADKDGELTAIGKKLQKLVG